MQKITAKILTIIFLVLLNVPIAAYAENNIAVEQAEAVGLPEIIENLNDKAGEVFPGFDANTIIKEISQGNLNIDSKGIFERISGFFIKEVKANIAIVIKVLIIAILCAVLKNLQDNLQGGTSEIAFYICYLLMVSFIIVGFKDAVLLGQETVYEIVGFMEAIIPTLVTLMISMGNVTSSGVLYPVIMAVVGIVSTLLATFIIPAVLLVAVLSIAGNISDKIQLSKLSGFVRIITVWTMGLMLTIFVSIVSVEASLAGTIDGVTGKTFKFAFSKAVPFVGQILSDSVETVLGCSLIIKNSIGVLGMILILGIVLIPLIKILAMALVYKLAAVLVQPITDSRITKCLDDVGGTLVLLFSIIVSISFMFIIAIAALIKTGGIATMIR
ncbi:MAG: stage III sporulation protein AE [Ignavibacteriales bacterium]